MKFQYPEFVRIRRTVQAVHHKSYVEVRPIHFIEFMLKPEFNRMKQLINNRPTHAATKSRRASMHMYISVYISTI